MGGPCIECREKPLYMLCYSCQEQLAEMRERGEFIPHEEQRFNGWTGSYSHNFYYEPQFLTSNHWPEFIAPPPPPVNNLWEQALANIKGGPPAPGRKDLRDYVAMAVIALFAGAMFLIAPRQL